MRILEHFEVGSQKYYLCPQDIDALSTDLSARFKKVGELRIDNEKHVILQELKPTGAEVAKMSAVPLLPLTPRELEIVVMVSSGLVNKVIADRLGISDCTVSTHLRRIFAKLRVDSRAEMVYRCAHLIRLHKTAQ